MIRPTNRVNSIELSQIRKLFENNNNPNAINLAIGEPDFDVPQNIKDAMKKAIDENDTHYTPNNGTIELREAIVEKLDKDNNIKTEVENILVTVGAAEAINSSCQTFLEKGDEVLLPNPYFIAYESCIKLTEAKSIPVNTYLEDGFKLKAEEVEKKITDKTKVIFLNSPSNPTGAVMEKEDIKAIAEIATDNDILIISDEIYEKIIYGKKHISPGAYSDNVITINGFSKSYAMTGLRIGYLNASEKFNDELLKVHQYTVACATSISQKGALEALTGPQDSLNHMVKEFKRRRDFVTKSLNSLGYKTPKCEGAFYIFPEVGNADEFIKKASDAGVIAVPGIAFGLQGKNHVRMSYATSYENLEIAMERLENI